MVESSAVVFTSPPRLLSFLEVSLAKTLVFGADLLSLVVFLVVSVTRLFCPRTVSAVTVKIIPHMQIKRKNFKISNEYCFCGYY